MFQRNSSSHSQAQSRREQILGRVLGVLACPECKTALASAPKDDMPSACPVCGSVVTSQGDQIMTGGFAQEELRADWLNRIKESAKQRLGPLYPMMINVLSPVYLRDQTPAFLKSFDLDSDLVADLGSGTKHYGDRVVCVDGARYPNVHVVGDLQNLPFRDSSISGLLSIAVLEHVSDPAAHVREMGRVLRPGGRVLCYFPFIQGFHASPRDYQRLTDQGLRQLFDGFEVRQTRVGSGPTSALLWIFQEWIALGFSFGSRRLYRLLVPLTWLLSPLKFLDLLMIHHPDASVIACGQYIEARKPTDPGAKVTKDAACTSATPADERMQVRATGTNP
jgi:SAM-dependent methyltransferase